jgi:hypothetical protein
MEGTRLAAPSAFQVQFGTKHDQLTFDPIYDGTGGCMMVVYAGQTMLCEAQQPALLPSSSC